MSDPRYDILFGGELLPGFEAASVADNLGRLFKATPETVQKLMGGGTHTLKRGTDRDTALKYQAAMQKAGAKAILREVTEATAAASAPAAQAPAPAPVAAPVPATPQPAAPPQPAVAAAAAQAASSAPLSLAPRTGDILAEHEKRVVEAVVVDTRHIKLVSTFMAPEEAPRAPPPPAPDTRHLSVAEVGADLLPEHTADAAPPPPDTSAITLAEAGARLVEEAPPLAFELPDISAITLAPPGAALEELRPQRTPLNPDTSALNLEPLPR